MKRLFLFLSLLVINCGILFAEDITITTYYPSPHGSYDELTANEMKIGSNYSLPATDFESSGNGLLVEGNVGIGTTEPTAKLQVIGLSHFAGNSSYTASNAVEIGNDVFLADLDTANTMGIYGAQDSTVGSIKLGTAGGVISGSSGNVGIGTTAPWRTLHVNGSAMIESGSWTGRLDLNKNAGNYIAADINGLHLGYWSVGPQDGLVLRNGSGNVGIGTTNPQAKLDVQGGTIRGKFKCQQVAGVAGGTSSIATCPANTWLLTGGGWCEDPSFHFIHHSYPVLASQQWIADCYGVPGQPDRQAYATAICCDY